MRKIILFIVAGLAFTLPATRVYATEDSTDIIDITDFVGTVSGNEVSDMLPPDPEWQLPLLELEEGTVSGNDISDMIPDFPDYSVELQNIYMLLSDWMEIQSYNSADGTIPEPYLSYIKGCLSWSGIHDNYVAFVSQYYLNNRYYNYYVIAIGNITYSSGVFVGSDVDVYTFYPTVTTSTGTNYRYELQSSFRYAPSGYLCFTDLSSSYPDLRSQDTKYLFVIVTIIACAVVFYTVTKFGFGKVNFRRRAKRG